MQHTYTTVPCFTFEQCNIRRHSSVIFIYHTLCKSGNYALGTTSQQHIWLGVADTNGPYPLPTKNLIQTVLMFPEPRG